MQRSGLSLDPTFVLEGDWSTRAGYAALLQLAEYDSQPTAVFAQNDLMAVGMLRAARDIGIAVPHALSVIGVDDIPLASQFEPPLTTLRQDFAAIGREAARLLFRAMEQPDAPPYHLRIPPQMVLRKSTHSMAMAFTSG